MARLVDVDKLISSLNGLIESGMTGNKVKAVLKLAIQIADAQPTVDADPVKHGHWITWFENEDVRQAKCSECGMMFTLGKGREIHYCGNCGARMDEVEDV